MQRIVMDENLRERLLTVRTLVEICDASGNVIGHFAPSGPLLGPTISDEEFERRMQSDTWYTTEQVLENVKDLTDV